MANHYVLICGGRTNTNAVAIDEIVTALFAFYGGSLRIMHGDSRGVDRIAGELARQKGIPVRSFPADWQDGDRTAGFERNQQMADYLTMCVAKGHTAQVIAFRGGNGTADMVRRAEAAGHPVDEIDA